MADRFIDKTVLVTGAAAGIGRHVATAFGVQIVGPGGADVADVVARIEFQRLG